MRITFAAKPPTVVLMAGLQGSGKTTTSAKLARWFKSQGRNPLLVGADLQRPAAVEQLRTLGRQIDVPVFSEPTDPVTVAGRRPRRGPPTGRDVRHRRHRRPPRHRRRADGGGPPDLRGRPARLHVPRGRRHDRPGRGQRRPRPSTRPSRSTASSSPSSTATPGAAPPCRSRRSWAGPSPSPSTGEKLEDFDLFHPDRLAGRILGMGDMLTLIEKAEEVFEKDEAEEAAARHARGPVHPRRLPRADAAAQEDGPPREPRRRCCRACPRSCATPRSTTASSPGSRPSSSR